jgi:predicted Zn-dependent protease
MPPLAIPDEFVLPNRPQYNSDWLFGVVANAYPAEVENPAVNLMILTPVDIWLESQLNWNWAFGEIKAGGGMTYKNAIISHYRMDDRSWGWYYDEAAFEARVRKMLNKYIAITYFGLPLSSNPQSATFNAIRSVRDLDRMAEHIPMR